MTTNLERLNGLVKRGRMLCEFAVRGGHDCGEKATELVRTRAGRLALCAVHAQAVERPLDKDETFTEQYRHGSDG